LTRAASLLYLLRPLWFSGAGSRYSAPSSPACARHRRAWPWNRRACRTQCLKEGSGTHLRNLY